VFEQKQATYEKFGHRLTDFLKTQLKANGLKEMVIKNRVKTLESFKEKITRPDKNYSDPLNQITDLTGVRIIVLYSDQIQRIEEVVKKEFYIDPKQSIDKSKSLKPDTFGYLSVHYIISINQDKENQADWKEFQGLKAEIQIRTSLQDTWATVSHALQYKHDADVPYNLKRKLFRLAGLFELADEQFQNIKNDSLQHSNEVKKQIEEGKMNEVKIDFLSILQFLSTSTMMREALGIANSYRILGNQEMLEHYNRADCSLVTEECFRLKIDNIEKLEKILRDTEKGNRDFLKQISKGRSWKTTNAFILFLLIIKAYTNKYEPSYLANKYGWDHAVAKSIIEQALTFHKNNNN
jgi:ppGpp synthetase/RelA/SpoT-type nucleotidyltranferase